MKVIVQRLTANPKYAKALVWGKLVTITGLAQVIVQVLGFFCGILIIRKLNTQEYALYTLANTVLSNMIILADSGIGAGVMSQGSSVWQDREKLSTIIYTGLDLRKKFAIMSLIIALPALLYLLLHHGASWLMSMLIIVAIIPSFFTTLSGTLLEIAPKLRQDIVPIQKVQIIASLGRMAFLSLGLIPFPFAFIAILSTGIPQIWTNKRLWKISKMIQISNHKVDDNIRKKIFTVVKRLAPEAIYICMAGQITIWLISFFGTTASVAQLGALTRLAMILNIIGILFTSIVVPRFARLPNHARLLFKRFYQVLTIMLSLTIIVVSVIWCFSTELLMILGQNYLGLENEVVLMMLGSSLYVVAQSSFSLCTSRGWIINPLISIPICIISIVCGILLIDVSTLQGVLLHSIFVATVQLFMHIFYGFWKISKAI